MSKTKQTRAKALPVDFVNNEHDWTVVVLCTIGFSNYFIARETGLTEGQVNYRIGKANLQWSRYNFRHGLVPWSARMVAATGLTRDDALLIVRDADGTRK